MITGCGLSEMIIPYPEGTHVCVLDCVHCCSIWELWQNSWKPEIKELSAFLSPACRRKWPHHGLRQRQTPQRSPLAVTLLQQSAINIIFLAASAKESITKGHRNGRSFQIRTHVTGSQPAVIPAGQKPCWKCMQSFSLQGVSLGHVSFAAISVAHSPSSHPRVCWMWLPPVARHSSGKTFHGIVNLKNSSTAGAFPLLSWGGAVQGAAQWGAIFSTISAPLSCVLWQELSSLTLFLWPAWKSSFLLHRVIQCPYTY